MNARRIDYIGLIWRNDADYFQESVIPLLQQCEGLAAREVAAPGKIKVRVGRARSGDGSTYEVDAWGHCADTLANFMPTAWWLRLSRLDYREEIGEIDRADMAKFGAEVHRRKIPGFNTTPLDKRDAAKTDRRGIGGGGIQIGSWRSERSLTIYRRRKESAAVEIRMNAKLAKPLGEEIHHFATANPGIGAHVEALAAGRFYLNKMLMTTIGTTDVKKYVEDVLDDVANLEDAIAEMAARRDSRHRGQMDFWQAVGEVGADLPGLYEIGKSANT